MTCRGRVYAVLALRSAVGAFPADPDRGRG